MAGHRRCSGSCPKERQRHTRPRQPESSPQPIGARIYGSWTCPACRYQLNLFGPEASADIPYVECNKPDQYPDQALICRKADLRVYPTWELSDGSRLEGVQSLDTLRRWSGLD